MDRHAGNKVTPMLRIAHRRTTIAVVGTAELDSARYQLGSAPEPAVPADVGPLLVVEMGWSL